MIHPVAARFRHLSVALVVLPALVAMVRLDAGGLAGSGARCIDVHGPAAWLLELARSATLLRADVSCGDSLAVTRAGLVTLALIGLGSLVATRGAVRSLLTLPGWSIAATRVMVMVLGWVMALLGRCGILTRHQVTRHTPWVIAVTPGGRLRDLFGTAGRRAPPVTV